MVPLVLWEGTKLDKLGKLGRAACAEKNQSPPPPPGTNAKEKLQLCVKVSTHPTHRCKLYTHTAFVGHEPRIPLTAPNGIHKWQNCTQTNGLSGIREGQWQT